MLSIVENDELGPVAAQVREKLAAVVARSVVRSKELAAPPR
jgi:hypothetical protein